MGRRKRRSYIWINVLIIMMFLAVIGAGAFFYINANRIGLVGEWHRTVDVTDEVADSIKAYLREVLSEEEIDEISLPDKIEIDSILIISKDGTMTESVDEVSYYDAQQIAKEALTDAVIHVIEDKMQKTYIETDMTTQELIKEATGMELSDYLDKYGPRMMPSMDELNESYGMNAAYTADRTNIEIARGADTEKCDYALSHGMLVIDHTVNAAVYHKSEKPAEDKNEEDN
ncbi:MAG: hypothetical protein J6Z05_04920 [Lachnospiraceae bacterium]|nr:hypothetical protein [Lachnospiraceae bacterium]